MGRHKIIEDDELLARARDIFVKEGINVSSRKIAEQIGISSSVLFQRFGSKEELFFAAMTPPAPDMSAVLEKAVRRGHIVDQLEQISVGLVDYYRKVVPVLVPLATHPSFRFDAFRKRHPNSPLEKLTVELISTLEEKRQKGEIECPDVGMLAFHLLAAAHTIAMFEWIGVHESFDVAMVRKLVQVLWRGVAPGERRKGAR